MNSPTSYATKSRGEPVRILERGMDYLDPLARQDDRIGGGHPGDCLRHGRISIAASPSPWMPPTVATRRCWPTSGTRTPAPGRSASAGWKTACVLPTTVPAGSTSANSPAQGVRPEPLRLFFCPRQLGFYPPHGRGPPAPGTLRRHSIAREPAMPAYRALDRSAVRRGSRKRNPRPAPAWSGDTAAWFRMGPASAAGFSCRS